MRISDEQQQEAGYVEIMAMDTEAKRIIEENMKMGGNELTSRPMNVQEFKKHFSSECQQEEMRVPFDIKEAN